MGGVAATEHQLPGAIRALRGLGRVIGLTGALYVLGYVTEQGREGFLGVATAGLGPRDYAMSSARLLSDVLALVAEVLEYYGVWLVVPMALLGLLFVGSRRLRRPQVSRRTWIIVGGVFGVLGIVKVLVFDVPILHVSGVLLQPKDIQARNSETVPQVTIAEGSIWADVVCARVGPEVEPRCGSVARHRWNLHRRFGVVFLLDLVWMALAACTMWRVTQTNSLASSDTNSPGWELPAAVTVVSVGAMLNLWTLPHVYARTLQSTELPIAEVRYEEPNPQIVGVIEVDGGDRVILRMGKYVPKGAESEVRDRVDIPRTQIRGIRWKPLATKEKWAQIDLAPRVATMEAYVLGESESVVTVFDRSSGGQVVQIPRAKIASFRVLGVGDPLRHRLEPKLLPGGPA